MFNGKPIFMRINILNLDKIVLNLECPQHTIPCNIPVAEIFIPILLLALGSVASAYFSFPILLIYVWSYRCIAPF